MIKFRGFYLVCKFLHNFQFISVWFFPWYNSAFLIKKNWFSKKKKCLRWEQHVGNLRASRTKHKCPVTSMKFSGRIYYAPTSNCLWWNNVTCRYLAFWIRFFYLLQVDNFRAHSLGFVSRQRPINWYCYNLDFWISVASVEDRFLSINWYGCSVLLDDGFDDVYFVVCAKPALLGKYGVVCFVCNWGSPACMRLCHTMHQASVYVCIWDKLICASYCIGGETMKMSARVNCIPMCLCDCELVCVLCDKLQSITQFSQQSRRLCDFFFT